MRTSKLLLYTLSVILFSFLFTSCDKNEDVLYTYTPGSPRSLASGNGKIYVSLFEGHVLQLDTATLNVEKTVQVGSNPEGIVFANNKIYVANSGGMALVPDSTISVIDPTTFSVTKNIKVTMNPVSLKADSQGNLYVISNGDYGFTTPVTLQRIDATTGNVTKIAGVTPYNMTITGDSLYMYSYAYDENWNVTNKQYLIYNTKTKVFANTNFIASDAIAKTPYSIDVNPITKDIYIGESDYTNAGKMYCFGQNGTLKSSFATGLNPSKTIFAKDNKSLYVLNQGKLKGNNAGLTYFDTNTNSETNNYFYTKNSRGLGDTGQDIIRYGSKIYIAVYNSRLLEIIDAKTGVSIKSVPMVSISRQ